MTSITDNFHDPWTRIAAAKGWKESECAQVYERDPFDRDSRPLHRLHRVSDPSSLGSDFLQDLAKCVGKLARSQYGRPEAFFTQSEDRNPPIAHFHAQRVEQRGWRSAQQDAQTWVAGPSAGVQAEHKIELTVA
jgi:hypothetical protein